MNIATKAGCCTPYSFNTINRTTEIVSVDLAMRNSVSLGSVNIHPGESYTLQVKGRPDLIEAHSKRCNVFEPVPVPEAHIYRASVNVGADGHCSLSIYAKG